MASSHLNSSFKNVDSLTNNNFLQLTTHLLSVFNCFYRSFSSDTFSIISELPTETEVFPDWSKEIKLSPSSLIGCPFCLLSPIIEHGLLSFLALFPSHLPAMGNTSVGNAYLRIYFWIDQQNMISVASTLQLQARENDFFSFCFFDTSKRIKGSVIIAW